MDYSKSIMEIVESKLSPRSTVTPAMLRGAEAGSFRGGAGGIIGDISQNLRDSIVDAEGCSDKDIKETPQVTSAREKRSRRRAENDRYLKG